LVRADGTPIGICSKLQLLIINWASVSAGQAMKASTAASLKRYTLWLEPLFYFSSNLKNLSSLFGRIGLLLKRNKIIFSSSS